MDSLSAILATKARIERARRLAQEARRPSTSKRWHGALLDFIPAITPKWQRPDHLAPLAALLERAQHEPVRAVVSVPPRHGKTETLLHAIAWWLARHPDQTVGYASYAADIARSKSRLARDYARAAGVQLRDDSAALHEWRTPENGGLLATGVGGPLTGHGVNLLIVDDPIKNRQDAESALIRENTHQWFTSTAMTRVEPGGSVLVVHTRWHQDDLAGRLARDTETAWEVVNLPALLDTGESLWPSRWPPEALQRRRSEVGEYDWASLYQGDPRPRGGQLFQAPARYVDPKIDGARIVIGCDPAASEKTHADYSVAVVLAITGQGHDRRADVLEVVRAQVEIPKLVSMLRSLSAKWTAPVCVEAVGGFKAVPQMLRAIDRDLNVVEVRPEGDKFLRAQPVAAAWNEGRVRVPVSAPWLPLFLDEVQRFTGLKDPHDDQVDALAHAWNTPVPFRVSVSEASLLDL